MGTRADFYVGRGEGSEWLGSIGWDGYPDGIAHEGGDVLAATADDAFREAMAQFFARRNDATVPSQGWPWPWDDSCTTDYAYAFDGECVWISHYGGPWRTVGEGDPAEDEAYEDAGEVAVFPNMRKRANVAWDGRSGLIIISAPEVNP